MSVTKSDGTPDYKVKDLALAEFGRDEIRLADAAAAPAGAEDCACALQWLYAHAAEYGIDPARIVVSGGLSMWAMGMSLDPMTLRSVGTRRPSSVMRTITPAAWVSVNAITAVAAGAIRSATSYPPW